MKRGRGPRQPRKGKKKQFSPPSRKFGGRGRRFEAPGARGGKAGSPPRGGARGGGEILGRLDAKATFGFVIPDSGTGEDLYVPRVAMGGAMNGDLVRARIVRLGGRPQGEILEVIERATDHVVGTIEGRPGSFFVQAVGGGEPVRVRGEAGARTGERVFVKITRWPDTDRRAEGDVEEVLGTAGDPDVELRVARLLHRVPGAFPEAVRKEAEAVPSEVTSEARRGRLDLESLECFTIDPVDARDHDDAVSLETLPGGKYRLGVHIADVSWAVREGTALDEEAYRRGTSTYLADGVIPMLPFPLSAGFCSLLPDVPRLAASVLIDLSADGEILSHEIRRSVIRSRRRFTYEEVDEILEKKAGLFSETILSMQSLAQALFRVREKRGAIDLDLKEVKPDLSPEGKVTGIHEVPRTWSHRLIEEFMVLANEVVGTALALAERGIWRAHEPPDPKKLDAFRLLLLPLGHRLPEDEIRPGHLQEILRRVADRPEETLVSTMLLRSLKEARYQAEAIGHYGLGARHYSHFTSPIRRYADLLAHRLILGTDTGRDLTEAAIHLSLRERAAEEAEYEDLKIRLMEFVHDRLGEVIPAVISGLSPRGLYVRMFSCLDGFLPVGELADDYYSYEIKKQRFIGRRRGKIFRLGDPIEVRLARVTITDRTIEVLPA